MTKAMLEKTDQHAHLRRLMVERQIRARGVTDQKVLDAMLKVPRHLFVPEKDRKDAYADYPLPIGYGQTISQPFMVAVMTASLGLKGGEKVLEIGTGSGYQAAVLAEIAGHVITIERLDRLSREAAKRLADLGYDNVTVITGDGTVGWPEHAPYDGIVVTAGAPGVPPPLLEQLDVGGRLVIPVGDRFTQVLEVHRRRGEKEYAVERNTACRFVDLIGRYGWDH